VCPPADPSSRDPTGSSAIAGRFRLESVGRDGRHEASLTLNLRTIDRVLTGTPDAQLVGFERLGRTKRYAQVLGHELAHAVWTLAAEAAIAEELRASR
jgi:hypothetical protein